MPLEKMKSNETLRQEAEAQRNAQKAAQKAPPPAVPNPFEVVRKINETLKSVPMQPAEDKSGKPLK